MWRDVWERYIALLAWLLCIPTLGICRGMQLMNVVLGGTLYQDLQAQWPKERPALLRHHARGRVSSSTWSMHPVQVPCPESRLALAVRGSGELDRHTIDPVLSMHHQAIQTLAPDLVLTASAPDGVIEAFEETASARWWVGVQFHPEWMTHLTWSLGLFTALVEASRSYSTMPREELEPSLDEIQGWLRQQDSMLLHLSPSSTHADPESIMVGRRRRCLSPSRGTDESRAAWSRERIQKHCDDVRDHPCGAGHVPCLQNKIRRRYQS